MAAAVEQMIDRASVAFCERRYELADQVISSDTGVDQQEVQIEEECLKVLALHQPVAVDLRRVTAMMKVNNDLERIADLAGKICERTLGMRDFPDFEVPERVTTMVALTIQMVSGAINAFVNLDVKSARNIILLDDTVDEHNRVIIGELQRIMQSRPASIVPGLHCFSAVRSIERIADHATNISEDVVYMVVGDIVRHRKPPFPNE